MGMASNELKVAGNLLFRRECNLSRSLYGLELAMAFDPSPVGALAIKDSVKTLDRPERSEPVYGGYANARGDIILFAKELAYLVNFKNHTLKERPPLNAGAQARYDAAEAGEDFVYGNKTFRRLSPEQISDICTGRNFRLGSRF